MLYASAEWSPVASASLAVTVIGVATAVAIYVGTERRAHQRFVSAILADVLRDVRRLQTTIASLMRAYEIHAPGAFLPPNYAEDLAKESLVAREMLFDKLLGDVAAARGGLGANALLLKLVLRDRLGRTHREAMQLIESLIEIEAVGYREALTEARIRAFNLDVETRIKRLVESVETDYTALMDYSPLANLPETEEVYVK
ncbi:MAG TPA: hypothetical protein VNH11_01505 [Pirellulales bacterium]|nr:hypothetical protein [Pirellulales bacterium]